MLDPTLTFDLPYDRFQVGTEGVSNWITQGLETIYTRESKQEVEILRQYDLRVAVQH